MLVDKATRFLLSYQIKILRVLLCVCTLAAFAYSQEALRRPNVLLILADDQGYGDLSLHANPHLKTPNLDRLAGQSVEFKNFYVSPVCAPTRAALMTGRYPQRTGVRSVTNGYETMAADEVTMAELLKSAGYRTAIFGKWHLGETYPYLPGPQGFDEFIGFRTGHTDNYFDARLEHNGKPYPTKDYITDALTDDAIRFIDRNRARPFLSYIAYNAPHTPLQCPEKYVAPYRAMGLPEKTALVYGMIANLDENVGRLLARLEELRLADKTLVIFMSDNGMIWGRDEKDRRFNKGLRDQKFTVYEGGVRVPFLLRPPQAKPQAHVVESVAAHIDVLPTALDYCRVKKPAGLRLDGASLRPLVEGRPKDWTARRLFLNYSLQTLETPAPYPGGVVFEGHYKMVNGKELYNLQTDPGEAKNLADAEPMRLAELDRAYRQWWTEITAARGFGILPIQIGHRAENPVVIPMHLGRATGEIKFQGIRDFGRLGYHPVGVDGDWVTNWTSTRDQIRWELDVARAGRYEAIAVLRCAAADSGSTLRLDFGGAAFETLIQPADVPQGQWREQTLGVIDLKAGRIQLQLQAADVKGKNVMELFQLRLKRLK
jgi:arylsulfatase A-like enzyme